MTVASGCCLMGICVSSASKAREPFGIHSWKRQLELAIAWNRVDLAETEIFTDERSWKVCA